MAVSARPLAVMAAWLPLPVLAHGAPPRGPWWSLWNPDPLVLGTLVLVSVLYFRGRHVTRRAAGPGSLSFGAAVGLLAIALVSPVDGLSDDLGTAHMIQHMLLMLVAAPLFILSGPAVTMAAALPTTWRRTVGRLAWRFRRRRPRRYWLWQPLLTWALFAAALWVWHVPALYEAALASESLHHLQHLMFFGASCLFWRAVFDPFSRLRLDRGLGVIYLFATSLHATLLGVFMALAPRAWYPGYAASTGLWRLTPLEDQQLAGLLMWMPGCMVYAVAAAMLGALWLRTPRRAPGRRQRREEHD